MKSVWAALMCSSCPFLFLFFPSLNLKNADCSNSLNTSNAHKHTQTYTYILNFLFLNWIQDINRLSVYQGKTKEKQQEVEFKTAGTRSNATHKINTSERQCCVRRGWPCFLGFFSGQSSATHYSEDGRPQPLPLLTSSTLTTTSNLTPFIMTPSHSLSSLLTNLPCSILTIFHSSWYNIFSLISFPEWNIHHIFYSLYTSFSWWSSFSSLSSAVTERVLVVSCESSAWHVEHAINLAGEEEQPHPSVTPRAQVNALCTRLGNFTFTPSFPTHVSFSFRVVYSFIWLSLAISKWTRV